MTDKLRNPDSVHNYTPTHGVLLSGKGMTRSCGKCMKHKPINEKGSKHPVLGWVCLSCRPLKGTKK